LILLTNRLSDSKNHSYSINHSLLHSRLKVSRTKQMQAEQSSLKASVDDLANIASAFVRAHAEHGSPSNMRAPLEAKG